jgi:hypothetical protein
MTDALGGEALQPVTVVGGEAVAVEASELGLQQVLAVAAGQVGVGPDRIGGGAGGGRVGAELDQVRAGVAPAQLDRLVRVVDVPGGVHVDGGVRARPGVQGVEKIQPQGDCSLLRFMRHPGLLPGSSCPAVRSRSGTDSRTPFATRRWSGIATTSRKGAPLNALPGAASTHPHIVAIPGSDVLVVILQRLRLKFSRIYVFISPPQRG